MLKAYRKILQIPGAARFSLAAALARFPMSMQAFSIILMISLVYEQYALAGQVNAVVVISYGVGTPVLARLVDRYGQSRVLRPVVLIYSGALATLLVCVISKQSALVLYLSGIFVGFFGGSFGAYVRARWSNLLDSPKQLNTAFALEAAVDEVIYIIGPMVATVLVQQVHPTAGGIVCIGLALVGGMWLLSQRDTEPAVHGDDARQDGKRSLLRNGAIITLCAIFMLSGLVFGALDIFIVAFTRDLGKPGWAGILLACTAVGSLVSALIYGSRDWAISPLRLFIVGMALMSLSFSTFFFATNLPLMVLCSTLCGFSYAPTMTNATNLLREVVPVARFTEGMAWLATSATIGASIGTSVGGNIIDKYGWYGGMLLTVAGSFLMLVVVLLGIQPLRYSLARARRRRQVQMDLALEITKQAGEKFYQQEQEKKLEKTRKRWRIARGIRPMLLKRAKKLRRREQKQEP